jgi:stage III sporulation protein AH
MTKKKKIIIMSTLVLLLAVTAVLNVLLVSSNETQASADAVSTANYFSSYRSERTTTRSEELLQLDSVISLYDEGTEKHTEAVNLKMKIVEIMEDELVLETMIKSLGFADAVVSIGMDSENVNVFINSDELNMDTALSIYNLLRNEAGVAPTNIIIMPVYSQI